MTREGFQITAPSAPSPRAAPPPVGTLLHTVYGLQQVTAVEATPGSGTPAVHLRPVKRQGSAWVLSLTQFPAVVQAVARL